MGRLHVHGIAQVCAAGAGLDALRAALDAAPAAPEIVAGPGGAGGPVLRSRAAGIEALASPRQIRRLDAFSQRMLLAGLLAAREANLAVTAPERIAVVSATGFGPLGSSFGFLDEVLDKRDSLASPLLFAASVHNAPAANLSAILGTRGPMLTVTGFSHLLPRALEAAAGLLEEGVVDRVLLVAGDEFHPAAGYGLERLGGAAGGRLRPLDFAACSWVPGEAFAAFVLGLDAGPRGWLEGPLPFRGAPAAGTDEPLLLFAQGDRAEGETYAAATAGRKVAAYSPHWGSSPAAGALTLVTAAIALAGRRLPPVPFAGEAPAGVTPAPAAPLDRPTLACLDCGADTLGYVIRVGDGL